jgi:hypothetical protein
LKFVIDREQTVHIVSCKSAKKPVTSYLTIPKDYIEMRKHLARPDRGDKVHTGASFLKPCDLCVPANSE